MDASSDSSSASWLEIALDVDRGLSEQEENMEAVLGNDSPIVLLERFVTAVPLDFLQDTRPQPELSACLRSLCLKAPSVAQYFVKEILEYFKGSSWTESPEIPFETNHRHMSKKKKQSDTTYHAPKGSKKRRTEYVEDLDTALKDIVVTDDMSTIFEADHSIRSDDRLTTLPTTDTQAQGIFVRTVGEIDQQESQDQSAATGAFSSKSAFSMRTALHHNADSKTSTKSPVHTQPAEKSMDTGQSPCTISCEAEVGTDSSGTSPSTPVPQITHGLQSPLSGEQTLTPATTLFTDEAASPLIGLSHCGPQIDIGRPSLREGPFLSPSDTGQQEPIFSHIDEQSSTIHVQSFLAEDACNESSLSIAGSRLSDTTLANSSEANAEHTPTVSDCQSRLQPSLRDLSLTEMVARAVHLMHNMSKRQEVPSGFHARILCTLCPSLGETSIASAPDDPAKSPWINHNPELESAFMWIHVLEAGQARSEEATILNMIEWMGASKWYDAEVAKAEKAPPLTKGGKPRKRLATVVLDKYLGGTHDLKINAERSPSRSSEIEIETFKQRRRINKLFHRGRILNTLVQKTHLGILFDSNIWSYAKAAKEDVDKVTDFFRADQQKMKLLSLLSQQVELLVNTGQPDLTRFLDSLESNSLLAAGEVSCLRADYGLEKEPLPNTCLDNAIDRVVESISHIFGERTFSDDDFLMIHHGVELPCGLFSKLRSKEWLDLWDIAAILEMIDRPDFVKLGLSVPLHEKDAKGSVTPIQNPFRRWRTTIDEYRLNNKKDLEQSLVYLCPLNLNTNHFTLLEINEQSKTIYHYDSMASAKIIYRKTKFTTVRQEVEKEFKDLGFKYVEAPCPQQQDAWSCGLMVIRNASRRITRLPVGSWKEDVDPDRVIKGVVENCQMFLDNNMLQPVPLVRKRKKKIEDVEGSNVALRSSKRLRHVVE